MATALEHGVPQLLPITTDPCEHILPRDSYVQPRGSINAVCVQEAHVGVWCVRARACFCVCTCARVAFAYLARAAGRAADSRAAQAGGISLTVQSDKDYPAAECPPPGLMWPYVVSRHGSTVHAAGLQLHSQWMESVSGVPHPPPRCDSVGSLPAVVGSSRHVAGGSGLCTCRCSGLSG